MTDGVEGAGTPRKNSFKVYARTALILIPAGRTAAERVSRADRGDRTVESRQVRAEVGAAEMQAERAVSPGREVGGGAVREGVVAPPRRTRPGGTIVVAAEFEVSAGAGADADLPQERAADPIVLQVRVARVQGIDDAPPAVGEDGDAARLVEAGRQVRRRGVEGNEARPRLRIARPGGDLDLEEAVLVLLAHEDERGGPAVRAVERQGRGDEVDVVPLDARADREAAPQPIAQAAAHDALVAIEAIERRLAGLGRHEVAHREVFAAREKGEPAAEAEVERQGGAVVAGMAERRDLRGDEALGLRPLTGRLDGQAVPESEHADAVAA